MMRCWPTVVPELPPTGAAGVGSLKPTPSGSVLTRTKLADCAPMEATARTAPARSALKEVFMGSLLRLGGGGGGSGLAVVHHQLAVGRARDHDAVEVVDGAADRGAAVGARHHGRRRAAQHDDARREAARRPLAHRGDLVG